MDIESFPDKKPLISVIINSRNGAKYLKECLDSVYAQDYDKWEIIFFDNASSDNTKEIINRYDNKIKYFYSEKSFKLYDARNKALKKTKGDLIAFLDSDDIWSTNRLSDQINLYNKGLYIIYGKYDIIDDKGNLTFNLRKYPSGNITKNIIVKNPISIGSILIPRKLIIEYSFDKNLEMLGDTDLWLRLSLNFNFFNTNTLAEYYRIHDNMTSISYSKNLMKEVNHIYKKNKLNLSLFYRILFFYIKIKIKVKNLFFY